MMLLRPVRQKVESLVDIGSMDGSSFKLMQVLAVISVTSVWALEYFTGNIAWWDFYAYPCVTAILVAGAIVVILSPDSINAVRLVTVATINALLCIELHMILWHSIPIDLYQVSGTLQWFPLGFGLSYLFLNMRAALTVNGSVLLYEFISFYTRTQTLTFEFGAPKYFGALLWNAYIAQIMYASMLVAIVYIKRVATSALEGERSMVIKAQTDPLTGVLNRRGIDVYLAQAVESLAVDKQSAIFLLDIDHFKVVNDTFGHAAGDKVLVEFADLIRGLVRECDVVGRWGGEEFLVLAPGATMLQAAELAERLRLAVQGHEFFSVGKLTMSVGISALLPGIDLHIAIGAADMALYQAKNNGRNRVEQGS